MGRFATGVTIVTTRDGDTLTGMTANAVLSLSLEPPLVLVSIDRESNMHGHLKEGGCFAVNVLRREHEQLSRRFAEPGPKDFSDLEVSQAETGAPILNDALAYADCRIVEIARGGDHDMFIGQLVAGETRDGEPLIFYNSGYGGDDAGGGLSGPHCAVQPPSAVTAAPVTKDAASEQSHRIVSAISCGAASLPIG